jgi:hypothetical protein
LESGAPTTPRAFPCDEEQPLEVGVSAWDSTRTALDRNAASSALGYFGT